MGALDTEDDDTYDSPIIAAADGDALLPYAQLGLRLLGVFFLIEGTVAIIGGFVYLIWQSFEFHWAGQSYHPDAHSMGWIASGVPSFVAGLYLLFSGNWFLKNVFSSNKNVDD